MQDLLGETSSSAISTQEKAARAMSMFAEMDTDDSGALDSTEFQCKCSDYGPDDSSIQQLFVALDANRDGEISVEEFVDGWAKFNEMSRYFATECKAEEVPFAALSDAISAAFATGTAVLLCDPSGTSSSFLQYNTSVMDCKGIFVLDKIHGKEPAEIQEKARSQLVAAMKGGQWLHMELGKSAPAIGEVSSLETFPGFAMLLQGFGTDTELHEKFVRAEEKRDLPGAVWSPRGDWTDKGHGVVMTTQFNPEDYREFLSGSWPEFPFDEMKEIIVVHDDA